MIEIHELKEKELNISNYLNYNIRRLAVLLDCDIIGTVLFDDNKNFAVLKNGVIKKENEYIKLNKNAMRTIKINSKSILHMVKEKGKIIYYKNDNYNEYSSLINISSSEVLIPIFLDELNSQDIYNDIIACIYIGNTNINNELKVDDINTGEIYNRICKIQNLYQVIYLNQQKDKTFLNLVNMMSELIRNNDPCGILHPYNVANIAQEIGKALNLDKDILRQIHTAGLLHDLGKLYIDSKILNKTGSLTEDEFEVVKKHSVYASNIIKDIFGLEDISIFVKHHHERYDGTGYPDGLKGEEIPLVSRILCLADAVDAMLSHKSYRDPKSIDFVISELLKNKSKQFDDKIVDVMVNILLKKIEETTDILSDTITWSTLTVNTIETTYSIEGTIGKYDLGYFFKADKFNFSSEIKKKEIKSISLYINKNSNMYCYKLKSDYYEGNMLHISEFDYIPFKDSFSILWGLTGIIHLNLKESYDINIYKIGGSTLMFSINDKEIKEYKTDKIFNLEVYFEDQESLMLSGKIVTNFKAGDKSHYEFLYINTSEVIRDQLFKRIFSKQVQMRRLINSRN